MKNVELRVEDITAAHVLLGEARYQKLSDEDKVKVWKISRKLFPVAEKYKKDIEDAKQKFMPSAAFPEELQVAIQYQNLKEAGEENLPISEEEYKKTLAKWNSYNSIVDRALKELADQIVPIEIEPVTEDAFGKLMASNDWSFAQAGKLEFIIG